MSEGTPLWLVATNALIGVGLVGWLLLTLPWLLSGYEPPVPGVWFAFPASAAWAVWNARLIMREDRS